MFTEGALILGMFPKAQWDGHGHEALPKSNGIKLRTCLDHVWDSIDAKKTVLCYDIGTLCHLQSTEIWDEPITVCSSWKKNTHKKTISVSFVRRNQNYTLQWKLKGFILASYWINPIFCQGFLWQGFFLTGKKREDDPQSMQ